ncbi:MAG: carbamate kinase [Methanomassiliicoccales archaeon]|nr:MAG: carbamate kinase [Methanomassiliicoccales archaeon]
MALIAIGGNAIQRPDENGSAAGQLDNISIASGQIAKMIKEGYNVVITHGNGPQVGNILLKNEIADGITPSMPMDVCVAESQGQIGYLIQQSLLNQLSKLGIEAQTTSLITQVLVDEKDDALENPTKPIGPYYPEDEAQRLAKEKGWTMMEDKARQGYRRVVASPEPKEIVEGDIIKKLLEGDLGINIIIAAGGGGIPVIRTKDGLKGVEAVVDKDLASFLLANDINADLLIMLTDVEKVAINFGKPEQEDISELTISEAKKYLKEGHFPPGSMGPKIISAIRFLECGGEMAIITTSKNLEGALRGEKGTRIVPG